MKKYEDLFPACRSQMSLAMFNRCHRLFCQATASGQYIDDPEAWIKSQARLERQKEGNWKGRH